MEFQMLNLETLLDATARFFESKGYLVKINSKTLTVNCKLILPIKSLLLIDDLARRREGEEVSDIQLIVMQGKHGKIYFNGWTYGYSSLKTIDQLFNQL
jgi:hypothetical protein